MAATIRLRAGKWYGSGATPGGYSLTNVPLFPIRSIMSLLHLG
jgi:hypothetical protein